MESPEPQAASAAPPPRKRRPAGTGNGRTAKGKIEAIGENEPAALKETVLE
jgi:hypothetical protein